MTKIEMEKMIENGKKTAWDRLTVSESSRALKLQKKTQSNIETILRKILNKQRQKEVLGF